MTERCGMQDWKQVIEISGDLERRKAPHSGRFPNFDRQAEPLKEIGKFIPNIPFQPFFIA
jgi:hypothetical protein